MRKVLGGIIGLVALLFLGLAYAELAHAEDVKTPECSDELAQKIVALYKADKTKVLSHQLELTTLKLAKETVNSKSKTVEKYILKQEATLIDIEEQKTVKDIKSQLLELYVKHGKQEDEAVILARMQKTFDVIPVGSYANKKTRFRNRDLSAYVLAHTLIHKDSPFKTEDAAILWLRSEISEGVEAVKGRGSLEANMRETSSSVARLTGYIDPAKGKSEEEIKAKIDETQMAIRGEFSKIAAEFASTLSVECAKLASCTDCVGAEQVRQEAVLKAIDEVGKNLQSDKAFKDKRVEKAIAEMKKSGIALDLAAMTAAVTPVERTVKEETGVSVEKDTTSVKPAEVVKDTTAVKPPAVAKDTTALKPPAAVKDTIPSVGKDTIPANKPKPQTPVKTPTKLVAELNGKEISSKNPIKLSDSQVKSISTLNEGQGLLLHGFDFGNCKAMVTVVKKGESLINHVGLINNKDSKVKVKIEFESPADPELQSLFVITERMIAEDDAGQKILSKACLKK